MNHIEWFSNGGKQKRFFRVVFYALGVSAFVALQQAEDLRWLQMLLLLIATQIAASLHCAVCELSTEVLKLRDDASRGCQKSHQ